jgi:succinyl-diaminopimelate desuccinylase
MMSQTLELASALIELPSITPDDAGCQLLLAQRLEKHGFKTEWLTFGDVSNVIFTHGKLSEGSPSLWFLGHTDVVPTGPESEWTSPPFEAQVRDGKLYGRGAADMKGAVAAMVTAAVTFVEAHPNHPGQVGILLTSDEEGPATDGVIRVAEVLQQRNGAPAYCLVGEPSSQKRLGDTVRIGRRGSVHAHLQVFGVQGHSAFPQHLDNPIHRLAGFIEALTAVQWDEGDGNFPPTHCQVTNIHAGTGAENVTPGMAEVWINFRNSPASPAPDIRLTIIGMLKDQGIEKYDLNWRVSGEPFRSRPGPLREATVAAIKQVLSLEPEVNTGGGTSDGRFIAPLGTEVLELGLINDSIHQIDENTNVDDLEKLAEVYLRILITLFKT